MGTKSAPSLSAILKTPRRFFRTRSFVPGRERRLSCAPPMTIVMALPGPRRRSFSQDCFETDASPHVRRYSLYTGIIKFDDNVSSVFVIPGYSSPNPVASEAKLPIAARDRIP